VHKASTCTGSWHVPGHAIFGGLGTIDGADSGDVGKTIDVRVHGERVTVPDIKNAIVLWVLGGVVLLFGLWALRSAWMRSSST
jgi:hypothetical protein